MILAWAGPFNIQVKYNNGQGKAREWHRILDLAEETEKKSPQKFTRRILQGQYAYCKYLEIIRDTTPRKKELQKS